MRLILRDISPDHSDTADPELEDGRLTLGRAPESATVEREGAAYLLVDKSRNGARVDGVDLGEGQRVRLRDGSHIVLGDRQFRAEIVGDAPAAGAGSGPGGAMPTISSILADISPRGETANSLLPGRRHEEDFDAPPMQVHRDRDVTVGYGGPPQTVSGILPTDWNSDFSTASEHVAATSTRVSLRTATPRTETPTLRRAPKEDDGLRAFLAGANIPAATIGDDPAVLRRAGAMLAAAMRALIASERDTQQLYADFDADTPIASTADLAALLLDEHGADVLAGRFQSQREAAGRWQRAAADIILAAADSAPEAVRARVDAQGTPRFGAPEKRYWRAIVEAHADAGVPVTLGTRLTDTLRRRNGGAE